MKRSCASRAGLLLLLLLGIVGPSVAKMPADAEQKADTRPTRYQEGDALANKGDYAGALNKYEAGVRAAQAQGDKEALARNWLGIAYVKMMQGDYSKAMELVQAAQNIAEEIKNDDVLTNAWARMGDIQARQGRYKEAQAHYEKTLQLAQSVNNKVRISWALNGLGRLGAFQGNYSQAIQNYQRALAIAEELGFKSGMTSILMNIGNIYSAQGSDAEAIKYYQRALGLVEELGDKRMLGPALINIGNIYANQGAPDQAVAYFQRALTLFEELGEKWEMAGTLINLASFLRKTKSYGKAIEYTQKALRINEEISDKRGIAQALNALGAIYMDQRQYEQAAQQFQTSIQISQEIEAKNLLGRTLLFLGDARLRMQKYGPAMETLQQALALVEEIRESPIILRAHYLLAEGHRELGEPLAALKSFQSAIEEIEKVRARVGSEEGKAGFFADKISVYESLIRLLHKLDNEDPGRGYSRQAFEYAERATARALLDTLAEARAQIRKGLTEEQQAKEQSIFRHIAQIQARLRQDNLTKSQREDRLAQLKQAEQELENFVADLKAHNPEYARLNYPLPYRLEQIQKELDDQTALIEFFLGLEQSFVFVVTRQDFQMAALPKQAELERQVKKYRQILSRSPQRALGQNSDALGEQYHRMAYGLYRQLLAPVRGKLKDRKRLILVPDGILHYVPFETLRTDRPRADSKESAGRYLLAEHIITYAPSASVWIGLKTKAPQKIDAQRELLAFGDPVVRRQTPGNARVTVRGEATETARAVRGLYDRSGIRLAPLPYTRQEVEAIRGLFPKDQQRVYLGAEASEAKFKRETLADYKRIHFATHALIDEQVPRRSGVVLSLTETGDEDGVLQMHEIFNLNLAAELVVLSACQTGLGKLVRGEGMVSLVRAFFYAGADNVVVSLWNVDDKSTGELMKSFYQQMKAGRSKAAALREAKLQMIRSAQAGTTYAAYAYPYYWGAFTLNGRGDR